MAPALSCPSTNMKLHLSLPHRAFKTSMSANRRVYWSSVELDINSHLLKSLPTSPPLVVTEPMRHLVLSSPRTVAPALCLAACELVGGRKGDVMAAACALRLMHAAAHTHGRLLGPKHDTCLYSEGVQMLTADGFIPLGMEMVATCECEPERVLRVIGEMSEAMGAQGVLERMLMGGSGEERLAACGAACGAILGGGSEEAVERLRRCGMYVGMLHGALGKEEAEGLRVQVRSELRDFAGGKAAEAMLGLVDLCFEEEEDSGLLCHQYETHLFLPVGCLSRRPAGLRG